MKLKRNNSQSHGHLPRKTGRIFPVAALCALAIPVLFSIACQPNPTILKDVAPPATPMSTAEMKKTSVQDDLREMQLAFDFIYVFRRKDGAAFDNEDRKYLRQNTPLETNKFLSSDEGKAFIAGAVFTFTPEQLVALGKRFVVEDFSKPEAKELARQQANTNKPLANKTNSNANFVKKEK